MAHSENSLSRISKDDLIRLALDYQQKYDITLDRISKELVELRKSYNKSESDLTKAILLNLCVVYFCIGLIFYFWL